MTFDPGRLRERVRFDAPTATKDADGNTLKDDYGNDLQPFAPQFTRSALYIMRPGSEAVLAARLTGRQPVSIVVRQDSQTRLITAAWQAVDLRDGTVWAIIAPPADMDRTRAWLTITAEAGVAS